MEQNFSTVIVPKTKLLDFHLKELVRYRDRIFRMSGSIAWGCFSGW